MYRSSRSLNRTYGIIKFCLCLYVLLFSRPMFRSLAASFSLYGISSILRYRSVKACTEYSSGLWKILEVLYAGGGVRDLLFKLKITAIAWTINICGLVFNVVIVWVFSKPSTLYNMCRIGTRSWLSWPAWGRPLRGWRPAAWEQASLCVHCYNTLRRIPPLWSDGAGLIGQGREKWLLYTVQVYRPFSETFPKCLCPASPEKEDQRAAGSPAALTQLALCLRLAPELTHN